MFQDNSVTYARGTFRDSAVANFNVTKNMQMTSIQCLQFIHAISQIPCGTMHTRVTEMQDIICSV